MEKWKPNTARKALCLLKACENSSDQIEQLFWNVVQKSCSYISREACVTETTLIQVYSLHPEKLLKKNSTKDIFVRPISNYSQLLSFS